MAKTKTTPFGSWCSPITSDLIVSESRDLKQVMVDGEHTYWLESRPREGGRNVIMQHAPDGRIQAQTPRTYNVRSRVHEYGGGAYTVANNRLVFVNDQDQGVYRQTPGSDPQLLIATEDVCYADLLIDSHRNRLFAVCEEHHSHEPVNRLVSLSLDNGGDKQVLVSGDDFYASPCLSPDGSQLAWLSWNHPNMPWDGTQLWCAQLDAQGRIGEARCVAGGDTESIFQPQWSPDGVLYFVSDRSGWWNLYRYQHGRVTHLWAIEAEFGLPQWVFGMSTYAFASARQLICAYQHQGCWRLACLDTINGQLDVLKIPYSDIDSVRAALGRAVFLAAAPDTAQALVALNLANREHTVLCQSGGPQVDAGYLSLPETIEFPSTDGLISYGFYYAPKNGDFKAAAEELPPLRVISHGGPTAATSTALNWAIQYWTSRGIGILDVNYGGSTGYGREYRERLNGRWGIVDVDDCVNGARYLLERGDVDGERLIIKGSSAGGYTTLAALTFSDIFKAGASYYGISDLESLAQDTHKFESRYLDRLIGPYPQERKRYRARSPIYFPDRLSCSVIFLQGLEDKVVPPNQAECMVQALIEKGLPVAYLTFEGEQHGFRHAENIKRALDAELLFYARIFGFELADYVAPLRIENLD